MSGRPRDAGFRYGQWLHIVLIQSSLVARAHSSHRLRRGLIALCVTEITSWGALYYSLPAAAASISTTTGWPRGFVVGSFSGGLLLSTATGIAVGRLLMRIEHSLHRPASG
jgi:hypothetical protein